MENEQLTEEIVNFIDDLVIKHLAKNCVDVLACKMKDDYPLWFLITRRHFFGEEINKELNYLPKKFWNDFDQELSYSSFYLRHPELKKQIADYRYKSLFKEFKRISLLHFYLRFKDSKRIAIPEDIDLKKVKNINSQNELIFYNLKDAIAWRNAIYYQNESIGLQLPIEIIGGFWTGNETSRDFIDWLVLPENVSSDQIDPDRKIGFDLKGLFLQ